MATTNTLTVREICTAALRKIGVVSRDEAAIAADIEYAREQLSNMLKHWQNHGPNLWAYSSQTVTLTTAASYTLNPVRPVRILSVRYNNGSTELPMESLTREEYDALPIKTTTGTPTTYYYDKQLESALLYIWPLMASVTSETLEVTYVRELDDLATLATVVDVPGEFYDCVVYCLADRLLDDFDIEKPKVSMMARQLYAEALAGDREGAVFFYGTG